MRITIKSTETTTRSGTSKGTNRPYTMIEQIGWVALDGEVRKVPVMLEREQVPWGVGSYELGDGSFYIGDYGRLMIGRLDLKPVAAAAGQPQAVKAG